MDTDRNHRRIDNPGGAVADAVPAEADPAAPSAPDLDAHGDPDAAFDHAHAGAGTADPDPNQHSESDDYPDCATD